MNLVNIYFYRRQNPDNVLTAWPGCVAVPRVGDIVHLGVSAWQVERVTWSHPSAGQPAPGNQVVDIVVKLLTLER